MGIYSTSCLPIGSGLLTHLKVREAILAFKKETDIWLPDDRDQACTVIGKFTQEGESDSLEGLLQTKES